MILKDSDLRITGSLVFTLAVFVLSVLVPSVFAVPSTYTDTGCYYDCISYCRTPEWVNEQINKITSGMPGETEGDCISKCSHENCIREIPEPVAIEKEPEPVITQEDEIEKKSQAAETAEIIPQRLPENAPPIEISQPVISEVASDVQEQGNLVAWKEKLREETGADSDVSKTLNECERQKQGIIKKCQSSPEGWSVIVEVSINDLKSGKNYDFQESRTGGCKKSRRFREPFKVAIDSRTFSASESQQKRQTSRDHQASCSLLCSSWNCEDTYLALIESYEGAVSVIRNGKTLSVADISFIQEGDVIVTGDDGMVVFKLVGEYNEQTGQFNDNDMVEVMPNSRLNIIDPELGADLMYGNAKVHIEKGSNRKYAIRTVAARVVAKGTDYIVAADPSDGKTNVYLSNGTLQIVQLSTNEAILINSGEKLTVSNQDLGTPVQMVAGEWKSFVKDIMPAGKTPTLKDNLLAIFIIAIIVWAMVESVQYVRKKKSSSKK